MLQGATVDAWFQDFLQWSCFLWPAKDASCRQLPPGDIVKLIFSGALGIRNCLVFVAYFFPIPVYWGDWLFIRLRYLAEVLTDFSARLFKGFISASIWKKRFCNSVVIEWIFCMKDYFEEQTIMKPCSNFTFIMSIFSKIQQTHWKLNSFTMFHWSYSSWSVLYKLSLLNMQNVSWVSLGLLVLFTTLPFSSVLYFSQKCISYGSEIFNTQAWHRPTYQFF